MNSNHGIRLRLENRGLSIDIKNRFASNTIRRKACFSSTAEVSPSHRYYTEVPSDHYNYLVSLSLKEAMEKEVVAKANVFLYYSKDLSVISMNHALLSQMEAKDWERIKMQMQEDLKNYYAEMGGV